VSGLSVLRSASVRTAMTVVTVPVAAGSLCLVFAPCASASVVIGTAVLAAPGATASSPLPSGASSTPFTVALPPRAACPGDTAHDGYRVFSYLVPKGTDLSSVTFVDDPSTGYGLVDGARYYGAVNTAIHTGQIIGIPNDFEWGALVRHVPLSDLLDGRNHGVWETGLACADARGTLSDAWNTQVTFVARSGDPDGFAWTTGLGRVADSSTAGAGTAGGGSAVPVSGQTGTTVATAATATTTPAGVRSNHSSTGSGGKDGTGRGSSGPGQVGGTAATDDAPVDIALALGVLVLLVGMVVLVGRVVQGGRTGSSGRGR
jgi:hypothetical protein